MPIRPIVRYPDPRLATPAAPVTVFDAALADLARDLADTLIAAPGVGITAPHIGVSLRLVVLKLAPDAPVQTFVNPVILALDGPLFVPKWALIALAMAPIVLRVAWVVWDYGVRPRLIPQAEIERLAKEMIDRYDDPEEAAFTEHHAAWFRSNAYEQGKWLRLRKTIR